MNNVLLLEPNYKIYCTYGDRIIANNFTLETAVCTEEALNMIGKYYENFSGVVANYNLADPLLCYTLSKEIDMPFYFYSDKVIKPYKNERHQIYMYGHGENQFVYLDNFLESIRK